MYLGWELGDVMTKAWRSVVLTVVVGCVFLACAPGGNPLAGEGLAQQSPAGFFLGVWHGFIVVFSFIVSLFSDSVGVYEVHNTGWPYNLGYLFGIMMFFGGGGGAAGKSGKRGK